MKDLLRPVTESLARRTSRRGLFSRGAELATGVLLGAAAGTLTRAGPVSAGGGTVCGFPGPPCPCDACNGGTCAKPCIFSQCCWASGCWVTGGVTCCDCACGGMVNDIDPDLSHAAIGTAIFTCGCGSDFQGKSTVCP